MEAAQRLSYLVVVAFVAEGFSSRTFYVQLMNFQTKISCYSIEETLMAIVMEVARLSYLFVVAEGFLSQTSYMQLMNFQTMMISCYSIEETVLSTMVVIPEMMYYEQLMMTLKACMNLNLHVACF